MARTTDLVPGALIEGRFELIEQLDGRGAGEAWRAHDTGFDGRFAMLKFFRAEPDDKLHARVARLREIRHPNLLAPTGSGSWQGRLYVVYPWFDGVPLEVSLGVSHGNAREIPRLTVERAFDQVCSAVAELHDARPHLVHGALQHGGVLARVRSGGELDVRVIDAGLGPVVGGTGTTKDTPAYDLAALAEVLRRALKAFTLGGAPAGVAGHRDVPQAVWGVLDRASRAEHPERLSDVAAMRTALRAAWANLTPSTPAQSRPAPTEGPPPLVLLRTDRRDETPPQPRTEEPRGDAPVNPWATALLRQEVTLPDAPARVQDFTQLQDSPVQNPWATAVLHARVRVDEDAIPTGIARPREAPHEDNPAHPDAPTPALLPPRSPGRAREPVSSSRARAYVLAGVVCALAFAAILALIVAKVR